MMLANKKILILGGASLHCKVVEAARKMGIYTIVVDNLPNSPAKKIADEGYDIDIKDVDAIVKLCRLKKADAVISVCIEFAQSYYQQICERLKLPCWGTLEQFQILTQKERFKKECSACGVDVIPSYSLEAILSDGAFADYPVLVKPSESRGSRGIAVCHSRQEVLCAAHTAKEISADKKIVIEKYMGGKPDFQVTYLVADGIPYVVRTADRFLGNPSLGMDRVAIALSSPSKYTDLYFERVHASVERLVKRLGLKNAPLFFQGFVDGDTIRFYDPGLRFPGGDYDRIFADVMGFNLIETLIELAFTEKINLSKLTLNNETPKLKGNTVFTLHSTVRQGSVSYVTPVEEITAICGVSYATYRHGVGDTVGMTRDVNQRILETNILGADIPSVVKTIQAVQNKLIVLDENRENMIFCEFDAEGWANQWS